MQYAQSVTTRVTDIARYVTVLLSLLVTHDVPRRLPTPRCCRPALSGPRKLLNAPFPLYRIKYALELRLRSPLKIFTTPHWNSRCSFITTEDSSTSSAEHRWTNQYQSNDSTHYTSIPYTSSSSTSSSTPTTPQITHTRYNTFLPNRPQRICPHVWNNIKV
ncbi:hypothetical protein BDV38DRAFT_66002 [Aspergillus pseudotamarii]|uniref:Uncharacterized protein n=1 Tax=Aspergillus pseudotamarii TaxID=132259 RepID=A0A5N6TAZ5_ASPPS|nr:uncharacterized protein BDV38DRAFT_66002 [Aspergillus pseudotamarii]KAE8143339.1 hypothetical protein BDV38DRAFT_66002 [Aspergillus pseudotamarii]